MEKIIASVNNQIIKEITKLKLKKYRNLTNTYLVEGHHLVNEALNVGSLKQVFYLDKLDFEFDNSFQVSKNVMKKLSDVLSPQGIVGVVEKPLNQEISNKVLLLDNVQDPGNIGTLIRSAVAFGFETIIATNSVDFYNEKVIRSSQGAIFKIALMNTDILEFINNNNDYFFLATDLKSEVELKDLDIKQVRIALILGNEGQGVSKEILDIVKNKIKIKMKNIESLNVGVAGSIIMNEIFKRSEK